MNSLICIQLLLPQPDPILEEVLEDLVWQVEGVAGVERQDDQTWSALVEDPRPRPPGSVRWRVYFDGEGDEAALREAIAEPIPEEFGVVVDSWRLDDLSFLEAWKEHFKPHRVSPRLAVHPPWEIPTWPEMTLIQIEPGMAFGTGTHETTRLCLQALDEHLHRPGLSLLDVGTGSGVLAIAAARLGAAPVFATDNDPVAVEVALENCAINGVSEIRVDTSELDSFAEPFDVVVANILPHVLIELHDPLVRLTRDGGVLLLSGILLTEADKVKEAFAAPQCELLICREMGEWCGLEFRVHHGA